MGSLQLRNITKSYGATDVIKGVDLDVADGEFTVFVGPSGCGKSTLLRIVAGLEDQTSGHVAIDGRTVDRVAPAKREIAMVFQSYALYPHLDVAGNMGLGLKQAGMAGPEVEKRIAEASRILRLEPYLKRKPSELSGGQRQRAAIGRAIVREPRLFLFDEPLSNLDAALRVNTRLEIAKLHKLLKATIIYVTHDQVEAMTLADKIVVLNAGKIEQVGTPMELYRKPANLFVAGFIGSPKMNFLDGDLAAPHGAATLGVRPEHLQVARTGGTWRGTVAQVEHLGADSFVYAELPGGTLVTARIVGDTDIAAGETIGLTAEPGRLYRFDRDGRALG